jgi:hypothetical protein
MVDLRRDPVMNAIHNGIRKGIVIALENRCFGSAVILILSGIDAMAYLSMPDGQDDVKGEDFIAWAEKYVRFPGGEQLGRQKLHGDEGAKFRVLGLVHDSHSTATEFFEDAVVGDGLPEK